MAKRADDQVICPGYEKEPGAVGEPPPRVVFEAGRVARLEGEAGSLSDPPLLARLGSWTLMAVFRRDEGPVAVLEQVGAPDGQIAFISADGPIRLAGKTLEPTSEGPAGLAFHHVASWYRGHRKEDVLPDHRDVMRDELLAGGRDPGVADVAACYPPARHAFFEGHLRPHTFVGTGISGDVVPLYYRDVTMVSRVPIGVVAPGSERAMEAGELWEGLVGSFAPIVRTVYPLSPDECWEIVVFGSAATATDFQQPVWYRCIRLQQGKPVETKFIDSFLPFPQAGKDLAERFYAELLATLLYWDDVLDGGMTVTGWDEFSNRSRHALAREVITRRGNHPKYGIADQAYAGAEHDGFQDVLVSSVLACLEWGHFDRARAYLDDYLTYFVRPDGTLHYRGPEMGKYGVMLTCLALHADYSGDASLLRTHRGKVDAIIDMLIGRWQEARRRSPDDPAYGMICGYHEADINFLTPNVYELDYDRPYLSNTAEAWRGLRDLGRTFAHLGRRDDDATMADRGESLEQIAGEMFGDAQRGVERSWLTKEGVTGLPIIAGDRTFYWEHPYRARPESYDENRVWSELFFGGTATKDTVQQIWDIAGERGHTTLGVFNNRKSMVGFLVWEEIAGLLQHDMIPEALLTFYAQALHAHSRGTWTAIECVDMDRARGAHSPYCLPAQMTVPIVMKWLLVYENPVTNVLTLGHAIPRERLSHGATIAVRDAPTRYGKISFQLYSRIDEGEVEAKIELPERRSGRILLRLRTPLGRPLESATLAGDAGTRLPVEGECVELPVGLSGEVTIIARWKA
ncbi:MAG TPA: hypothetical protein VHB23_00675 [Devosiaceae bacterium]|nr:hypothetical protein [Devosiaceae bacterium]